VIIDCSHAISSIMRLFRIQHHRERDASLHQLLYYPVAVYRKKKVCVCVSFAGRPGPCHAMSLQSPRLRHYRSKHQIRYMPSKKVFSMCCIQWEKKKNYAALCVIYIYINIHLQFLYASTLLEWRSSALAKHAAVTFLDRKLISTCVISTISSFAYVGMNFWNLPSYLNLF